MEWLPRQWTHKGVFICGAGLLGDAFVLLGIITPALDTEIAGFTAMVWMLLALVLYPTAILPAVLRITARLESRQ